MPQVLSPGVSNCGVAKPMEVVVLTDDARRAVGHES
jgi:hypothetical protein